MNMLIKAVAKECRGPISRSNICQPPIQAFMDDLTVKATSVPECQGFERLVTWARMSFKPTKCWSLFLRKGRGNTASTWMKLQFFQYQRSLRKPSEDLWHHPERHGSGQCRQSWKSGNQHWTSLDKSSLPGKLKSWIYQRGILPRLLRPLLIYKVPKTIMGGFEQNTKQFLLCLPKSQTSITLYGHTNKLLVPLSSRTEDFK